MQYDGTFCQITSQPVISYSNDRKKAVIPKLICEKVHHANLFQVQSDFHHWTLSKSIRNTNAIESTRNTLILESAAETQLSTRSISFKVNKALILSQIEDNEVR